MILVINSYKITSGLGFLIFLIYHAARSAPKFRRAKIYMFLKKKKELCLLLFSVSIRGYTLTSTEIFTKILFIDFRERGMWRGRETYREREKVRQRKTSICCSTYLCIHWLILVCALTGD